MSVSSGSRRTRTSMVPPPDLLPDVLPTERLTATGMPVPALRDELRRIPTVRNVANVASVWIQSVGMLALAAWVSAQAPTAVAVGVWIVAFVLMGRAFALFSILAHEAAHRLLFPEKRWNDLVGKWLLAYPAFVPFDAYRRSHFAHHKDELGPHEPDLNLYRGYPITKASWHRKLRRDAFGSSGGKNLKGLLGALRSATSRPVALRIVATQAVLAVALGVAFGRWWLWPLLWLAPWMTVWRVLNRLRAVAEHGGMERSADRRRTTHVVDQHWASRFWIVPFNTGWHLAHHADMGVPFQHLPAVHRELVDSGWVTPQITYRSYTQLWKTASTG
ncbi:fatty acid desaturase [Rhabdothermincola salaria]|uniref:fatty acid desaturase n=1 Tax=Rhabdothermincola salaria TaxID=2903142 RepID=UPI001E3BEE2C|nr:fatty acid desaturase [Rhabdothermincola salaria]